MLRDVPTPAALLGFLGLMPFIVSAVLVWRPPEDQWVSVAVGVQHAYGAVILSFLGGVRWGLAIGGYGATSEAEGASWGRLTASVVPAVLAWATLSAPPPWSLAILMIAFALSYFADLWASRSGDAPQWYAGLRTPLSFAVIFCLMITLFRFPRSDVITVLDTLMG